MGIIDNSIVHFDEPAPGRMAIQTLSPPVNSRTLMRLQARPRQATLKP